MLRVLLFCIPFCLLLASCGGEKSDEKLSAGSSSQPAESPNILINVQGANPGKVYLIANENDQNYPIDSMVMDQTGQVNFQRTEPYPSGLYYFFMPEQG